jgi:hypothetical protein
MSTVFEDWQIQCRCYVDYCTVYIPDNGIEIQLMSLKIEKMMGNLVRTVLITITKSRYL